MEGKGVEGRVRVCIIVEYISRLMFTGFGLSLPSPPPPFGPEAALKFIKFEYKGGEPPLVGSEYKGGKEESEIQLKRI